MSNSAQWPHRREAAAQLSLGVCQYAVEGWQGAAATTSITAPCASVTAAAAAAAVLLFLLQTHERVR